MRLRQLDTQNGRDVAQFIEFPFTLYRECPQWVPPLRRNAALTLNRARHPFYEHSTADFFVVESAGQTVGRMAMLDNRHFNEFRQTRAAFFGYFDAVDDVEVARRLFTAGFEWAKKRGLDTVIGPRGVIGVDGSVLVDGFEHRPALAIPYNYPYYDALIRDAGFVKSADLLSGYLPADHILPERMRQIAAKVKTRRGFVIKTFANKAEIKRWLPRVLAVHQAAFSQTRSYYPPTPAEVEAVMATLLAIVDPRLVKLVLQDEKIVGFILALHDVSAGLKRANGRLFPFGWYHILREKRRTDWVNVSAVGLLPAYQGLGANVMLYVELADVIRQSQFAHVEVIQVDEQNVKSRADMEAIGVRWTKRHRHYEKWLETQ
jgi:ribosomal protein S18 acetylase RimI-like enzyme